MLLSVVVPTFNKRNYLRASLACLGRQTLPQERFEVVVVNDGSTDGTQDLLMSLSSGQPLRVVNQENGGLSAARNRGIAESRGEHVYFMDDDILLPPDALAGLASALEREPECVHCGDLRNISIDAVPGLLRDAPFEASSWPDLSPHYVPSPIYDALRVLFGGRAENGDGAANPTVWWAVVTGGNLCVPRSGLDAVGGFDTGFRGWGPEDADLCYRLFLRGVQGRFVPALRLYHMDHPRNFKAIDQVLVRNATYFIKKYQKRPELLDYLRYFNGMMSLAEFNNRCAELYGRPPLAVDTYVGTMGEVTRRGQVISWK